MPAWKLWSLAITACHIFLFMEVLNRDLLLDKFATIGLDYRVLKWFHSYLTEHQQSVLVDEEPSNNLLYI